MTRIRVSRTLVIDVSQAKPLVIAAYLLCFIVPAAILVILMPQHSSTILLLATGLLVAVTAFLVGLVWENASWTPEARRITTHIGIGTLAAELGQHLTAGIHRFWRDMPWYLDVLATLLALGALLVVMYVSFFFGRLIGRMRVRRSAENYSLWLLAEYRRLQETETEAPTPLLVQIANGIAAIVSQVKEAAKAEEQKKRAKQEAARKRKAERRARVEITASPDTLMQTRD